MCARVVVVGMHYLSALRIQFQHELQSLYITMQSYICRNRSGVTWDHLDSLSVIHVAGTKGKGSTCAFTEAILRAHGFRTGFYSSPHLVSVTERLRIDGVPLNKQNFIKHFWKVYDRLEAQKEHETDMPPYFGFLTILMFHVFLDACVDVAIIEVGIGGEFDSTNIIRKPVCVGISSLGLDHTSLLGNTLEAIAFQKSGIFKRNALAFTVQQPNDALNVLKIRAMERSCALSVVPDFKSYKWHGDVPNLGIGSRVQEDNASLAIQLAAAWMSQRDPLSDKHSINNHHDSSVKHGIIDGSTNGLNSISSLSLEKTAGALSSCKWPGRCQVLRGSTIDFYIDGAHTSESIQVCASWYLDETRNAEGKRFLIFNATGDRDAAKLLKPLSALNFTRAYFVPNDAGRMSTIDQENMSANKNLQMIRCQLHCSTWGEGGVLLGSVNEALNHILTEENLSNGNTSENVRPQVLITGSLHLVGAAATVLDPELTMTTDY